MFTLAKTQKDKTQVVSKFGFIESMHVPHGDESRAVAKMEHALAVLSFVVISMTSPPESREGYNKDQESTWPVGPASLGIVILQVILHLTQLNVD